MLKKNLNVALYLSYKISRVQQQRVKITCNSLQNWMETEITLNCERDYN